MHSLIHWLLHRERKGFGFNGWVDDHENEKSYHIRYALDWQVVIPLVVGGALLVSFLIAWSK